MALEKFYESDYYLTLDCEYLNDNYEVNGTVDLAYPFSNEKLDKIFKYLGVNAKVLTVGSSGDQMLNALYYGASEVVVIDANLFSKYWIDYKISAIKNLSYNEFCDNFIYSNNCFDKNVYQRIFQSLDTDSQTFWGTIFLDVKNPQIIYNRILRSHDVKPKDASSIFYCTPKAYKHLKNILLGNEFKIKFINREFCDFANFIKDKYDLILLSNIYKFVKSADFISVSNKLYKNNLKPGGIMQLHYDFNNKLNGNNLHFDTMFGKNVVKLKLDRQNKACSYLIKKPILRADKGLNL